MKQKKINQSLIAISVLTIIFGVSVIVEQLLNVKLFSRIFSGYATVKMTTAVCFVLSGCAFLLLINKTDTWLKKTVFRGISIAVICCGIISFIRELHSIEMVIQFMMEDDFGINDGRMATISSFCFVLLGSAFLALNSSYKKTGQYLLHLITLGSFIALMGYIYNVPSFYTMASPIGMAIQSALAFFIVSISATQLNPELGISGVLRGDKIGNITARKIFPYVLLFALIRVVGMHFHFISDNFGSALFTTCFVFGGLIILSLTSTKLNRIDEKRTEAESKIIDINQGLENMVEKRTLQLVTSNHALLDEIDERRKTEAILREVSDRFSKIFHSSPSGKAITVLGPTNGLDRSQKGLMSHQVVDINKALLEILGYREDEVVCDHLISLEIIVDDKRRDIGYMLETYGYFKNKEAALVRSDGQIQNCILSVEPIDIEGESHFLWVCYDNSERKKMEIQLHKAKEAAEQLAQIKEQFLANMSHEIRTPMNSIIGFSNLLNKTSLDKTQKEYVSTINTASENLLHLINEILDYSKLESGKITVEKSEFVLRNTLQTIHRMFTEKAREKNLRLSVTFDKKLPERIVGDESKLYQILMNLVGNSFKFTKSGSIQIDCALITQNEKNLRVKFSVKDTGIGISSQHVDGVFERFNLANAETAREFGGTGLGLSIVKQLVEAQGGEIKLESILGVGSEFCFVIEYEQPCVEKVTVKSEKPSPQRTQIVNTRSRVLLAEDNVMNQKLAAALLKEAGCEVDIAENGLKAVEMLRYSNYDIVLMDIQMPLLDGYRASQLIREKLKSNIPIIAVTAHAFKGERERCLSYGMNDYITKPYDEEDLLIMLLKYLPEKRALFATENDEDGVKAELVENTQEAAPSLINLSYLHEISKGNKAFVNEMIEVFLNQNEEQLQRLSSAMDSRQFDIIGTTVHSMKTTTSFVGLHNIIGDNLLAMERLAHTQTDFEDLRKNFRIVQTQCMLAQEELKMVQV